MHPSKGRLNKQCAEKEELQQKNKLKDMHREVKNIAGINGGTIMDKIRDRNGNIFLEKQKNLNRLKRVHR